MAKKDNGVMNLIASYHQAKDLEKRFNSNFITIEQMRTELDEIEGIGNMSEYETFEMMFMQRIWKDMKKGKFSAVVF